MLTDGEKATRSISASDATEDAAVPDLILLDLNLPRISGFEVLARIRASPKLKGVPVIIMTSSAANEDRTESRGLGANAYFQKPTGYGEFMKLADLILEVLFPGGSRA